MQWNQLRAPQKLSFVELGCQLASREPQANGTRFIRKGPPDSGIECFWRLANGDEVGWQVKWFLNSPSDSQWKQVDKSFRRALEGHPRLVKYYVCMPMNLPDARRKRQTSASQKWDAWVEK